MDRPDIPAIARLEHLTQEIEDAKQLIRDMDDEIDSIPERVAEQIEDEDERREAARYLYWNYDSIPVDTIKRYLLNDDRKLAQEVFKSSLNVDCVRCENPLQVSSRTKFRDLQSNLKKARNPDWYLTCDDCQKAEREVDSRQWQKQQEAEKARLIELRGMPYRDYLQTPEWQERRKAMLKSARYSCQICNSNKETLDVHHRTYERRGNENNRDLVVLCRSCHGKFHDKVGAS